MSTVQLLVGCVVLLAMAGGLIGSLRFLDRLAGAVPLPTSRRPRQPRHDEEGWPSYGWELAERTLVRQETTPVAPAS